MAVVSLKNITQEFEREDGSRLTALEDLSLTVHDKEFLCIVGPSGCGKTTILRIVAGLDSATSGDVLLDGQRITGTHPDIGMVFQEYSLFPWRTIRENVAFGLEMQGMGAEERRRQGRDYLQLVGLDEFADSYPFELSGGMRQRVAIARALATDPEVLLMDEPFGALDAQTRNRMQEELLGIWEESRKTVLFVTHSVDEAVYLGDRIVVLSPRPGRIRECVDVPFDRPRERTSPQFAELRRRVLALIQERDGEQ